jgi:hypothetical protein
LFAADAFLGILFSGEKSQENDQSDELAKGNFDF